MWAKADSLIIIIRPKGTVIILMSKLILVLYKSKYHCDNINDKEPEVSCSVINVNIYVCEMLIFLNVYIPFALQETKELLFFARLLFSLFNVVLSRVSVD